MTIMNKSEKIEKALSDLFEAKKSSYPQALFHAMTYMVFSDGKRVRPYLMLLSAEFLGVDADAIMPLAIALELIHTYSLIHDDLPCMDDDDYRRGKPSCHKVFGEAMAVLCGDALLNLAYETMLEAAGNDVNLISAASFIAKCAGVEGMVGGQVLEFSKEKFDENEITEFCMKKTGALIRAAILAPAYLGCDGKKFSALSSYANAVGLNFQLRDDLLDEKKEEKKSYLAVMGKEYTVEISERLDNLAKKALANYDDAKPLIEFSEFLTNRKK